MPTDFAPLTRANCPPHDAEVELIWTRSDGSTTTTETTGEVLQKYLALYGEAEPLRFRVNQNRETD